MEALYLDYLAVKVACYYIVFELLFLFFIFDSVRAVKVKSGTPWYGVLEGDDYLPLLKLLIFWSLA